MPNIGKKVYFWQLIACFSKKCVIFAKKITNVFKTIYAYDSNRSEFIAVYGRRRVGKTYLVKEALEGCFTFTHTGLAKATKSNQLKGFQASLKKAGCNCSKPKTWMDAFLLLEEWIENLPDGRKVIFLDELPWMDTPRSNFISALEHFWNAWATERKDIVLIVCGSATSWIVKKIINNHGGLHNRLTHKIHLQPFCLNECEQMSDDMELTTIPDFCVFRLFGCHSYLPLFLIQS